MSERRLYLNLGNTTVHWGVRDAKGWVAEGRVLVTRVEQTLGELAGVLKEQGPAGEAPEPIPVVTSRGDLEEWRAAAGQTIGRTLVVMGRDFGGEIRTEYRDPARLGQDRVANVIGARSEELYPCLILDAGTCLTADVLDEEGVHQGGAIAAGGPALLMGILAAAPHLQASVEEEAEPEEGQPWGLTTEEGISLGWVEGLTGIAQALIDRYWEMTDGEGDVILTGGDAEVLDDRLEESAMVRPMLALDGLRVAWEGRSSG